MFFGIKKSRKDLDDIGKVSTFAPALREKCGVLLVMMGVRSTKGCRGFVKNVSLKK